MEALHGTTVLDIATAVLIVEATRHPRDANAPATAPATATATNTATHTATPTATLPPTGDALNDPTPPTSPTPPITTDCISGPYRVYLPFVQASNTGNTIILIGCNSGR